MNKEPGKIEIAAPKGWRLLGEAEVLREGDYVGFTSGEWRPISRYEIGESLEESGWWNAIRKVDLPNSDHDPEGIQRNRPTWEELEQAYQKLKAQAEQDIKDLKRNPPTKGIKGWLKGILNRKHEQPTTRIAWVISFMVCVSSLFGAAFIS